MLQIRNLLLVALFFSSTVFASAKVQIQSMSEARSHLAQLQAQFRDSEILVVFDIDNTILTANQNLGGDAWFNWQAGKLKTGDTADLVAPDFAGLLKVQEMLFGLGRMHAPEASTPVWIQGLQDNGLDVLLLTSRGTANLSPTERELSRNGYQAGRTAPGPQGGYAGRFLPYDLEHPTRSCLTSQDVESWKLPAPKLVRYSEGVFYGEGQHKGAMLRSLLCKMQKTYRAILFVDDSEKNVDHLLQAYNGTSVEVIGLRYGQVDAVVEAFEKSDKRDVIEGWAQLKAVLELVF